MSTSLVVSFVMTLIQPIQHICYCKCTLSIVPWLSCRATPLRKWNSGKAHCVLSTYACIRWTLCMRLPIMTSAFSSVCPLYKTQIHRPLGVRCVGVFLPPSYNPPSTAGRKRKACPSLPPPYKAFPVLQTRDFLCCRHDMSYGRSKAFPVFQARHSVCSTQDIPCVPSRTFRVFQARHSMCSKQ